MTEKMPKQKSEKNTTKTRRPKVGKLVERYLKRIYDITGINPTKMVKGKDGKLKYKNIDVVRKLVKQKFPNLDSHGLNKHLKAIFDEQYKTPSIPVFERNFEPFGSNITKDISNMIERFNTNVPFIKPNAIKMKRKYDDYGLPLPIEVKYDYDDMRFDKYTGIKNDVRRYAVDIVNEVFKGANGEQSENMRTNIISAIHNINLETDPNESKEDIENKYKKKILSIIDNTYPYLFTLQIDGDKDSVTNSLNDLKQKLIDRIKNDDFDVDNDPIENYREFVEYGIGKMMSNTLTNELITDLNEIDYYIDDDKDKEYDYDTIDKIDQKLKHFFENIALKQIDGIVVDRALRKKYNEIIPKIEEYLHKGYNKYHMKNERKAEHIDYIYDQYLTETDAINNAFENTDDKEVNLLRDTNKSIDAKGGPRDKIVKEALKVFNETGQTTRKTDRKNIDQNMIANIIADGLDGMNDIRMNDIREVTKDVLERIKGKAESHASLELSNKTTDIMAGKVANRLFDTDEFRNIILLKPMKSLIEYVNMKPIERFEMLPPEQQADIQLREALNKQEDPIFKENILSDIKQPSQSESSEDIKQLSKEAIDDIVRKSLNQIAHNEINELSEATISKITNDIIKQFTENDTIKDESPRQWSTEVSDNNEYEEDEHQEDGNTSNEMSEVNETMITDVITPLSERIAQSQQPSETETPQITLQDVVDARKQIPSDDSNPPLEPELQPAVIQSQSTGSQLMPQNPNDIGRINLLTDTLNKYIAMLQYSQSSTDTNNLLGGIVSIFKELPNIGDDEIANKLSEAVGPDGKKLFESKEEAARFIAKMRALNGNRLSSIKGGGSGQKTGIQLNITNKVISNMPPKPFIVDTHPIPYQY